MPTQFFRWIFFLCLFAVDTLTQNRRFIFTFHYSLLSYCISRVAVCAKALQKDIVALRLSSWCGDAQPCYKSHIASLSFHSGNRSPDYLLAVSSVLESIHFKLSRCVRHQPRHPLSALPCRFATRTLFLTVDFFTV